MSVAWLFVLAESSAKCVIRSYSNYVGFMAVAAVASLLVEALGGATRARRVLVP